MSKPARIALAASTEQPATPPAPLSPAREQLAAAIRGLHLAEQAIGRAADARRRAESLTGIEAAAAAEVEQLEAAARQKVLDWAIATGTTLAAPALGDETHYADARAKLDRAKPIAAAARAALGELAQAERDAQAAQAAAQREVRRAATTVLVEDVAPALAAKLADAQAVVAEVESQWAGLADALRRAGQAEHAGTGSRHGLGALERLGRMHPNQPGVSRDDVLKFGVKYECLGDKLVIDAAADLER